MIGLFRNPATHGPMEIPEFVLFTKPACDRCDWLKPKIPEGSQVHIADIETREGLALAAHYEVIELAKETLPVLIIGDEILTSNVGIRDRITQERRKILDNVGVGQ